MAGNQIPMTQEAYTKLKGELEQLKKVERPNIITAIQEARSQGDLAENAEYHAAKEKQGQIEQKIMGLEDKIARAEIITVSPSDSETVIFGATVKVLNLKTKKEMQYQLVSSDEVDVAEGKISSASPIGKALIGNKAGDEVEADIPKGKIHLKIVSFW